MNLPFILKPATYAEIFKIINNPPLNKATGFDNISVRLLKEAAPIVTCSLTFIINLSIFSGIAPDEQGWPKLTLIITELPISVLPVVSKLVERVLFKQVYGYLNDNNLLTESQSGFRPMFSTETSLLEKKMSGVRIWINLS